MRNKRMQPKTIRARVYVVERGADHVSAVTNEKIFKRFRAMELSPNTEPIVRANFDSETVIGYELSGNFDLSEAYQAITSNGCSIVSSKIKREGEQ